MKKLIFLLVIGGLIFLAWPISSMSVQENIVDENDTYSWEQWCWYQYRFGVVRKQKVGNFSVEATGTHNQLKTDICN